MTSGLYKVKTADAETTSAEAKTLNVRKKDCLNKRLENSLRLEAAMLDLQKEFRSHSNNISRNVIQLGQLLGIQRNAA